ncbi:MAG: hypothetical protein R3305_09940, partial [Gammaproteobacteria bacterium]|nr:hypothetical protein [Gammaproteobacteria bacterium]
LTERVETDLAVALALRRPDRSERIIARQLGRIGDANLRARLEFVAPALSFEQAARDTVFEAICGGQARGTWAVASLELLNHPIRAAEHVHYIEPGMAAAANIHARGDIFLPRQWLEALFSGHGTQAAADTIERFVVTRQDRLPERFVALVEQTADPVYRAATLLSRAQSSGR